MRRRYGGVALLLGALGLALALGAGAASERHVLVEAAELRQGPGQSRQTIARLDKGTEVTREQRSGGWLAVRTVEPPRRDGWVRVWQVRTITREADAENPILSGLKRFSRAVAGLFGADQRGTPDEAGVTATIGVRGLKPGEFENAEPDPGARQRIEGFRASASEARAAARAAGLQRREVGAIGAGAGQAQDWGEW